VLPLTYRWDVLVGSVASTGTNATMVLKMPPAGTQIFVSVVVTDATGYTLSDSTHGVTVTAAESAMRERWCQLRSDLLHFMTVATVPVNPLGPDSGPLLEAAEMLKVTEILRSLGQLSEMIVATNHLVTGRSRPIVARPRQPGADTD
jgi:hypothetical protein